MQHIISHIMTVSATILRNLWLAMNMPKIKKQYVYIEKNTNYFYRHK